MIRPVLYVNLPGIVRAFDRRARMRQSDFAYFVVAPELEESRSGLTALLSAVLPITPNALTWICEDHWRLLGLAQAGIRPGGQAWDLTYLAALITATPQGPQGANGTNSAIESAGGVDQTNATGYNGASDSLYFSRLGPQDDTLMKLTQHALNEAIGHGAQRFFTRVESDAQELALFNKLGFQRYALETTYLLENATTGLSQLEAWAGSSLPASNAEEETAGTEVRSSQFSLTAQVGAAQSQPKSQPRQDNRREEESDAQHEVFPTYPAPGERPARHVVRQANQYTLAMSAQPALTRRTSLTRSERDTPHRISQYTDTRERASIGEWADLFTHPMRGNDHDSPSSSDAPHANPAPSGMLRQEVTLRKWRRHDAWGLLR
ncbi:MAG TPA: hypothetical protein VKQ36_07960, partial [Ktedonobacterales bacterium]|nr:hypothetical protein [Ktedonobacterales bacterium]